MKILASGTMRSEEMLRAVFLRNEYNKIQRDEVSLPIVILR
jgi:hypothetical protein